MTRVAAVVLLGISLVGCHVDGLDIGGKQCPCGDSGYTCDPVRNICVIGGGTDAARDPGDLAGADLIDATADLGPSHQVDVLVVGAPAGAKVAVLDGMAIPCDAGCSLAYPAGATLELKTVAPWRSYTTFEGACLGTGPSCTFTLAGPSQITVTFRQTNVMFVTSTQTIAGNLGGLSGADAKCQMLADQAMIGGTYRAWLSTSATNASTRLGTANGWIRPDGRPFAVSKATLLAVGPLYPPQLTEKLADLSSTPNNFLATGTKADGTAGGMDATGWTNTAGAVGIGAPHGGPVLWTTYGGTAASAPVHLMCFGVDLDAPLTIVKSPGRRAFVSTAAWSPASGLAAADALCQGNAMAASLGGSWKALLATTGASAASRFNLGGAAWVRVDGIPFLRAADLATAMRTDVPIALLASGAAFSAGATTPVFTGASMPGSVGAASDTCGGWTSTSGDGIQAQALSARDAFLQSFIAATSCAAGATAPVYCFEE